MSSKKQSVKKTQANAAPATTVEQTTVTTADVAPVPAAVKVEAEKKQRGKGIGLMAKQLLRDPKFTSYEAIADEVNKAIPGAGTNKACIQWYASKLRKEKVELPKRSTPRAKPAAEPAQAVTA